MMHAPHVLLSCMHAQLATRLPAHTYTHARACMQIGEQVVACIHLALSRRLLLL